MQTVERATLAAEVVEAITAAGYEVVHRPPVEAVVEAPAPRGVVRRATFGHRYLVDEAGDGSGYRRRGE